MPFYFHIEPIKNESRYSSLGINAVFRKENNYCVLCFCYLISVLTGLQIGVAEDFLMSHCLHSFRIPVMQHLFSWLILTSALNPLFHI
jgi:cytochrome b subunit of formate dehydrogenase